jgi:hypothetical protein
MRLRLRRPRFSPPRPRGAQPRLEILEDRVVPAGPTGSTVFWINPNGGDWDVPSNWSQGQVPTSLDQVIISGGDGGLTVTHSQGVDDEVASLTTSFGVKLNLTGGSLAVNGDSSVDTLQVNGGILILGNGTLAVANFVETAGLTQLIGGNLTSEQPIQILDGAVAGFGTIQADLFNGGLVQPVDGDLVVNGDYLQSGDGVLEVTPTSSPNTNDLVVQGNADLDGLLYVPDLQLPPGANTVTEPVLIANTITDSFAATQLDASPDSASVVYNVGEVDVVVTAPAQPPPGLNTSPSPNPSTSPPVGPSGPTSPITPAQPPPTSVSGQGNPSSPLPSPVSSSETAKVQASIAAARGVPPVGGANPGARVAAPPGSGANPGAPPGGGQAGPGAQGERQPGIVNSGSSTPPPPGRDAPGNSPPTVIRDALFDRHGLDRFEDGADEDLVDAFTLAFDLAVYTGEDTSLGVEAAVSLLAGSGQRASVLPQRGSSVAAVATLLTDDDSPRQEETAVTDGLDQLLINPLWKVPVAVPGNLLPPETLPEGEAEGQAVRTVPWWQTLILAPIVCVGAVKTLFSPWQRSSSRDPVSSARLAASLRRALEPKRSPEARD